MLREYLQQKDDTALLRLCQSDVDSILSACDAHIGQDGLIGDLGFWNFVDWNDAWNSTNGMKEGGTAARLLQTAIAKEDCLKCSFSTSYEWFRALEQAGLFDVLRSELDAWIELLALGWSSLRG